MQHAKRSAVLEKGFVAKSWNEYLTLVRRYVPESLLSLLASRRFKVCVAVFLAVDVCVVVALVVLQFRNAA